MSAATRIYVVRTKQPQPDGQPAQPRLVRCTHPAHALRHVAVDAFDVAVATHDDLEDLLGAGVKVERIGPEQAELPTT
jgi:hypothetical protein